MALSRSAAGGPPRGRATPQAPRRRGPWAVLLLLALLGLTAAAYQPAWHGGPLWDDDGHVTPPGLRSLEGFRRIWIEPGATQQYYPLLHSTFWLMHALVGGHTTAYHFLSIGLHGVAAWLFALLLARLGVAWPWLGALVFALHPVHVESVAWISELKNTLSGVWFLAAALAYLRFDRCRRPSAWALAAGLFVLALLSKTVTATLPVLLLVVIWWQRGRLDVRRDLAPLAPLIATGAAFGVLTVWVERTYIGARGPGFDLSIAERALIAGRAVWFYIGTLVWPADLRFIYPKWHLHAADWRQWLYPIALGLVLAAAWRVRGWSRSPFAGLAWFCLALAPALGFVSVFPFRYSYVADHFQYLASLGLIALSSGAAATYATRRPDRARRGAAAAVLLVVVPLGLLTWRQSHAYADAATLYRATIARDPASWMAHNNLAVLLLRDSTREALDHLDAALRANPDYPEAHNNRGLALQLIGRFDEAAEAHRAAIRLEPAYADAYNNLGTALQTLEQREEAADAYREAVRLRPGHVQALVNLGNVLLEAKQPAGAIAAYREALRLDASQPNARYALGAALELNRQPVEAMAEYRETLRLEPGASDAHARLAVLLDAAGRTEEALAHYEAWARLDPASGDAPLKAGLARYRTGDVEGAAASFREAVRRAPASPDAHNNLGAALERLGRLDEAAGQYREAVRLAPGSAAARENLARAQKKGRTGR